MKAKAKVDYSKMDQREYAFGMLKGPKKSEDWLHVKIAAHLRNHYSDVRFYSTLDGFNLGNQRSLVSSIQCLEYPGLPDLFIFKPNGDYTMLIMELKKDGERVFKKDGSYASEHIAKQADWLQFFTDTMNAKAVFAIGLDECKKIIDEYLNPTNYGKTKRKAR